MRQEAQDKWKDVECCVKSLSSRIYFKNASNKLSEQVDHSAAWYCNVAKRARSWNRLIPLGRSSAYLFRDAWTVYTRGSCCSREMGKKEAWWPESGDGYANNSGLAQAYSACTIRNILPPSAWPGCPAPNVPRPISAPPHLSTLPIATLRAACFCRMEYTATGRSGCHENTGTEEEDRGGRAGERKRNAAPRRLVE